MPAPTAIPFNKSTAEIMAPFFPVFSSNEVRIGFVPAPQNQIEFALFNPFAALATLIGTGAIVKTAFCGPCFGAGDTPANNAFSIRHSTRNFPNREGSKLQSGQISSVALMDARSIAATAANKGLLTPATDFDGTIGKYKYNFDSKIYANRVFDSKGVADPSVEIKFGPNIKDWPAMTELPENLLLRVVSEIHDPVTTTDELIPSGETSSYRSNPLGLAEFTLSRKDPKYVGLAKDIQVAQKAVMEGKCPLEAKPELKEIMEVVKIENAQEFDAFVRSHPKGHMMQSSSWGKVKKEWEWKMTQEQKVNRGTIIIFVFICSQ